MDNRNTGDLNTGNRNTGDSNTGHWNTGDWNTGDLNTGNRNTGDSNTGHRNTGDWNTGNWNTGNWNTGDSNTGHRNTGDSNTGHWNTGNWNTGNRNTGYLNTNEPAVRIFNRESSISIENITFPNFFYWDLTEWVDAKNMTESEKNAYPSYVTTGGYLKCYTPHTAWRNAWERADVEDRRKCLALPNWDNEVFKEISGIDVEKELNEPKKPRVQEYTLQEIANKLGVDVSVLRIKE